MKQETAKLAVMVNLRVRPWWEAVELRKLPLSIFLVQKIRSPKASDAEPLLVRSVPL